ncbi:PocR ligand-binding domain-containing protein [Porcipelethomonas sp.]|uniref:PocR ligand-binding domain-containing protein n=1 Tax=Porcipelethomonas sp. TaxID=2981675 RepID=UPI003EF6EB3D
MNDLDNLKLTDLIDVKTLQDIQDGFSNTTGMAALTTDADGTAVTKGSNFTDFCMELTRKSNTGCKRCEQCDKQGGENTMYTGKSSTYYCHAGLVDFAAPIMVNGKFIGSFIGGQVLTERPDEEKIRKYAAEIGVNPDEYVRAVRKVKVLPKHQIDMAADFLCTIANVLSKIAYSNYVANQNNSGLSSLNESLIAKIHDAEGLINQNSDNMDKLRSEFALLENISKQSVSEVNSTNETVKIIQDIAMNTRILGFNAYIEAARAKESGKSFGVITQEIRDLADKSKASADKIENAMKSIGDFTKQIDSQVRNTEKLLSECMANIEEFSTILKQML